MIFFKIKIMIFFKIKIMIFFEGLYFKENFIWKTSILKTRQHIIIVSVIFYKKKSKLWVFIHFFGNYTASVISVLVKC